MQETRDKDANAERNDDVISSDEGDQLPMSSEVGSAPAEAACNTKINTWPETKSGKALGS